MSERRKWRGKCLGLLQFDRQQKGREGFILELENEEKERVLPNESFLVIPPIYTSFPSIISGQVPPNIISLHLCLTPISNLYQQVWWGMVKKKVNMHVCI